MAAEAEECCKIGAHTEESNPQMTLKRFKEAVKTLAQGIQKRRVPKLNSAIKKARNKLLGLQQAHGLEDNPAMRDEVNVVAESIQDLERRRDGLAWLTASTQYVVNAV